MAAITISREVSGTSTMVDPCTQSSPPDMCANLTLYGSNENLQVSTSLSLTGEVNLATVSVSGSGSASLATRFVE